MKNFFKSLMCLAVVAMAFTACQKEESVSLSKTLKLTVDAVAEELNSDARTYIDNSNNILWGTQEQMTIALLDATPKFATSTATDAYNGQSKATFEFEIEADENSTYTYGGVYPAIASEGISNNYSNAYKVALPATQKATATSYDPAAYILLAKPVEAGTAQTSLQMAYRRITALNKITLTGLNADVKSVTITLPAGQSLAGRRYLDLTQGSAGEVYFGQTPSITVDYDTALTGASKDVWFTSWEAAVATGEQMTIKATTATHTYTRTITANSNGISFKEGHLNTLSVNMAAGDVVVESLADYSGSYLIVAEVSGVYYAMSDEADGSRRAAKVLEGYSAFADAAYPTNDASIQWTVAKDGANYTISNGENYLSWSSGNVANLSSEAYALKIDFDGTYTISSVDDPSRVLAKNAESKYGFAFYTSTGSGIKTLHLKEFVADTRTALTTPSVTAEVENATSIVASWNSVPNAAEYIVTCGTEKVTVEDTSYTFTNLENSTEYTVSVVAIPSDYTQYKSSVAGTATATTEASANVQYSWTLAGNDLGTSDAPAESTTKGTPSLTWALEYEWKTASAYFGTNAMATKGLQIGKAAAQCNSFTFSTSDFTNEVYSVTVNTSTASSTTSTITVSVGGHTFDPQTTTTTDAKDYVFTSATPLTGKITIKVVNNNTANSGKALYLKSIKIN